MENRSDDQLLTIIWQYLAISSPLQQADAMIVDGTKSIEVAHQAAELFNMNFAPLIVLSGGGQSTSTMSIAESMNKIVRSYHIPEQAIVIDSDSKNPPQVIVAAQKLLQEKDVIPSIVLLIDTPFMSRTLLASAEAQWKGEQPQFISHHPSISLPEYSLRHGRGETIRDILGNFQRLRSYAKKGYQSEQLIPDEVQIAYDALIWRGHKSR